MRAYMWDSKGCVHVLLKASCARAHACRAVREHIPIFDSTAANVSKLHISNVYTEAPHPRSHCVGR
eukprot:6174232-Pleurochrysis_carterae.AAC.1